MLAKIKHLFLCCIIFIPVLGMAQQAIVKGTLTDEANHPMAGVPVSLAGSQYNTTTDNAGAFEMKDVPFGDYMLEARSTGYQEVNLKIRVDKTEVFLGKLVISHDDANQAGDDIPTASLSDADIKESSSSTNISGVLGASRDAFTSATTFNFSIARFRLRGYDQGYAPTLMNGASMTDLTTGRDMFYTWSGLNDMVRARENSIGLDANTNDYGGLAGSSSIDSRAARQRKQIQGSYALSNRTYDNRLMLSYGSGVTKGGWSFAASVSRRWANEGYVKGTFYDSWAYFGSVEKELGSAHNLSLTVFGSPLRNGRQAPSTQEMYDIAGTNYYNPNWGYQDGKIRNASVGKSHIPVAILTHEWKINNTSTLESSLSRMSGKTKISGLDWFNATDPRPDFYRRLPSFIAIDDPGQAALVYSILAGSEEERQIKWDDLYESNYLSDSTLHNANGIAGNTVTGRWANYLLDNRVTEMNKVGFNTVYNKTVNDNTNFTAGFSYQKQRAEYYKEVEDLLGADFYVDLNQYAEQSDIDSVNAVQNDLNNPNRVLHTGDRYGYDYIADITKTTGWAQGVFKYKYVDYFIAGELSSLNYFREGKYKNGVFADDSYGKSNTQKFVDFAVKAGITYKLNGRNYFFVNGSYMNQAPDFDDTYISPRTRNTLANGLVPEAASSVEGGYLLKAPKLKARAVFYTTEFKDQINTTSFYHEDYRTFVNYTISNIDKRHTGAELAVEGNIGFGLSAMAVASLGRYMYTSNPTATISQDNKDTLLADNETVYMNNFHVGGTPEKAYTFGLNYRAKQFWFVNVSVNMFDGIYIPANPARRTSAAIDLVDVNSDLYDRIVNQEKVSKQVTVDLSAGKSWRLNNTFKSLKRNMFLVFNAGVTNLLNNKKFINGGYEQLRFDYFEKNPDKFASKYFYSYGTTFFVSVTFRLN